MPVVKKNKLSVSGSSRSSSVSPGLGYVQPRTGTAASSGTPKATLSSKVRGALTTAKMYSDVGGSPGSDAGPESSYIRSSGNTIKRGGTSEGYDPFTKSSSTRAYESTLRDVEGARPEAFAASDVTSGYLARLQEAEQVKPEYQESDLAKRYRERLQAEEDRARPEFQQGKVASDYYDRL